MTGQPPVAVAGSAPPSAPAAANRLSLALRLLASIAAGILLHFATSLWPHWWALWIAPVPLLVAAYLSPTAWQARLLAWLAAFIGAAGLYSYFAFYTSRGWAALIIAAEVLIWGFAVSLSRQAVTRWRRVPAVFVFPVFLAAVDTLVATLSPEGNAGSLAFDQARALPVIQIGSLAGNAAIVFLVMLGASLAALVVYRLGFARNPAGRLWPSLIAPVLILAAALGFGWRRARQSAPDSPIQAALLSVNKDGVDWNAPDHGVASADGVWFIYGQWVPFLAHHGINLVVLPEKIAPVEAAALPGVEQRLSDLARDNRVYLEVGVAVHDEGYFENRSWIFTPTGLLTGDYSKQHPVPIVESDYHAGNDFVVSAIAGVPVGIAICKDLDYSSLTRRYAQLGVNILLQPAWDAGRDGWWRTQVAILAGVENGYSVIHDSREGWLTISDPYGHFAGIPSANPGSLMAAFADRVPLGSGKPTLYARYGDWFGWLCVLASLVYIRFGRPVKPSAARPSRASANRTSRSE